MIGLFCFVLAVLASPFKSKFRLEAENAVLRYQLMVLRRRPHGRVRLTNNDRWLTAHRSLRACRGRQQICAWPQCPDWLTSRRLAPISAVCSGSCAGHAFFDRDAD